MSATLEWHGEELAKKIEEATKEALHLAGEIIAKEWQDNIPWATGELGSSLTVTDIEDGVEVSSSGPYAARQEFDATLRHPDPTNPLSLSGRSAHAGRDALQNNVDNIQQLVAAKIDAALR